MINFKKYISKKYSQLYFLIVISFCLLIPNISISQNINNCKVFPQNNIWNTQLDTMPIHKKSQDYINTIGVNLSLRSDFGSGLWNDTPIGIPYVLVSGSEKKQIVTFEYADESDKTGYPIPNNPPIEGGENSTGDRHILMIDTSNCKLYELFNAYQNSDKSWRAGSGSIFDLNSNILRTDTWTSADAAGLPIFPGLVRYEEVASGEINHLIRFTVPKTQRAYLWPARHFASSIKDVNYPPMGIIMRLKSTFDISKLSPQAKVVAKALQKYGMILADNGSAWFMSGVPNENWDNDDLYTLRQIHGNDFEAIDISSLQVDNNSGEVIDLSSSIDNEEINTSKSPFYISDNILYLNNLEINENIEVIDILGNTTLNLLSKSTNEIIDINHLQNGIYFLKINNQFEKFIK